MHRISYKYSIVYLTIICILVYYRYQVLIHFGFKYTDSDQAIMWLGTRDYSSGIIHEPRFYGQDYNSLLESFLAIPLYNMGVSIYKALPIVTSLISIFPYIAFSVIGLTKNKFFVGIFILCIPLILPIEYDLLTTMSRGFVSGIFIASIGVLLIVSTFKKRYFLSTFLFILGATINPNSLLLSLPVLTYYFWNDKNKVGFYWQLVFGFGLGLLVHYLFNLFYLINPHYVLHSFSLTFSFSMIGQGINSLNEFLSFYSPLPENFSFIILIVVAYLVYTFWQNKKIKESIFFLIIILVLICSLGINKAHNGTESIFFSKGRMFLALPVVLSFGLTLFQFKSNKWLYTLFLVPIIFTGFKTVMLKDKIKYHTRPGLSNIVVVQEVDKLNNHCAELNDIVKQHQIELLLIVEHYDYDLINYGCSFFESNFPNTLHPSYERRTWRLLHDSQTIYSNVLILHQGATYSELLEIKSGKFLLTQNNLTTLELMKKFNIPYRKFLPQ